MSVKIRLQRHGRKKAPFYHIVIADSRAPRDGRFIEKIGTYNPMTKPATIDVDRDKAFDWLQKGAQPTDTVRAILRFKGVMYRKHLTRGVAKGSLTEEQATEKYNVWIDSKEKNMSDKVAQTAAEKKALVEKTFGKPKPKPVAAVVENVEEPKELDMPNTESIIQPAVEQPEEPQTEAVITPAVEQPEEPQTESIVEPTVEEVEVPSNEPAANVPSTTEVEEPKSDSPIAPATEEIEEPSTPAVEEPATIQEPLVAATTENVAATDNDGEEKPVVA